MSENNSDRSKRSERQPFHHLVDQIDSFFNEKFNQFNSLLRRRSIRVHTSETKSSVTIEAELPGYKRDEIELEIIGNQLHVIAWSQPASGEKDKQDDKYQEYSAERLITLPFAISEKDTTAVLRDGILKISIPKKNESRRFINIYDDNE